MTLLSTHSLCCEYLVDPLGVDTPAPRLSWLLAGDGRGRRQTAYHIQAASSAERLAQDNGDLWDTGRVESRDTTHIPYAGAALLTGQRVWWRVRVWDETDAVSAWSASAFWQMGLLAPSDWHAQWIESPAPRYQDLNPCPRLRRAFALKGVPVRATLSATAHGVYELSMNGNRVGDAHFAPGWTDYKKRFAYQTYDVTSALRAGENALGATLGDGWWSGYLGFKGAIRHYGERPALLLKLDIEYADGSRERVVSDADWRAGEGPILYSDFQMGEKYDARLEAPGWAAPGFDDQAWQPVKALDTPAASVPLVAPADPPVRVTQEIVPLSVNSPQPGTFVFDLGQNFAGWARLRVSAPAGTLVQMRFGEMLAADGSLYAINLRAAKATDTYICKGEGLEVYEPHFTFHGFRYVEVTGFPGVPDLNAITGCVLESDTPPAGAFTCSDPDVNQLYSNIVWGQRGNFLSVPTDCPQRDERLGWMGDAQVFVRTATCNRDVAAFFTKWMRDVEDAQSEAGAFSDIAPRIAGVTEGVPAWADAGVIVPWTMYTVYGDRRLLETHYEAMTKWIDFLTSNNPDGLWVNARGNDYGDWLSVEADTDKDVLATAYFAYDTHLMAQIAAALGKDGDAERFASLFERIKAAFNAAYVAPDGVIRGDTQTAYVLALHFGLLPEAKRPEALRRLVADIEAKGNHLSTGFVGVGYLCPALTDAGRADIAYRLLLQDTFPSWLYSVRQGATTIWERWDGWTHEKGFQTPNMNSFNHYSLGSVGEWLMRSVAGIDTDGAGFGSLLMRPRLAARLPSVTAHYDSIRGRVGSTWEVKDGQFRWTVTVPPNVTATVFVPCAEGATVSEGGRPAEHAEGVTLLRRDAGCAVYETGSGAYEFAAALDTVL